jgi:acetyl/propionyl-CoA carboxylase alpha subunit
LRDQPTTVTDRRDPEIARAMSAVLGPAGGYVGAKEALATVLGLPDARIADLRSLPLGALGQRLVALRYFIANGETWLRYFAWQDSLVARSEDAPARLEQLLTRISAARASLPAAPDFARETASATLPDLAAILEQDAGQSDAGIRLLVGLSRDEAATTALRGRLRAEATALHASAPRIADLLYLATYDLRTYPATSVGDGDLRYIIVADKGEMGVRAVREAVAYGAIPVVLFSEADDQGALQVRLAEAHGGFCIGLAGSFRETYASFDQIARNVLAAYTARFGATAQAELARSALYPGYGPLAENASAIEHFRRAGIVFIGPTQDVVVRAGDKRKFRLLGEAIDPNAVTPGIVIDETDAEAIAIAIARAHSAGRFVFPGRLKAANGGGGRGQALAPSPTAIPGAVEKVLAEIMANGWQPGVMFEQNIPETIHLEVQIARDRFGNTRHFGMRDCSEQRASQKIQEEAPPALLRRYDGLEERICAIAVEIADRVGYTGAGTVEVMFKDGHFYLLEMNTRIQVEHPVTEAAHRIRTKGGLEPLDLVALQYRIAAGAPIPFAQDDVVCTHVAREFRINAESWRPDLKDPRDGQRGLFLPNGGIFDAIEVPEASAIRASLAADGVEGIEELDIRFDCGFEAGDVLVNKDPTFGKLIVAVRAATSHAADAYELLRVASIAVLRRMTIRGRQVTPGGKVVPDSRFETNLEAHVRVLESECVRAHARGVAPGRHVNWVVQMLRGP